jgi:hypothetical protein
MIKDYWTEEECETISEHEYEQMKGRIVVERIK